MSSQTSLSLVRSTFFLSVQHLAAPNHETPRLSSAAAEVDPKTFETDSQESSVSESTKAQRIVIAPSRIDETHGLSAEAQSGQVTEAIKAETTCSKAPDGSSICATVGELDSSAL